MKSHEWDQVKSTKGEVIAWQCKNCKITIGRHYPQWAESEPPKEWLNAIDDATFCHPVT